MFNTLAIIFQHHVFPKVDDSTERRRFINTLFSLIYTVQLIKSYIRSVMSSNSQSSSATMVRFPGHLSEQNLFFQIP